MFEVSSSSLASFHNSFTAHNDAVKAYVLRNRLKYYQIWTQMNDSENSQVK